jgi:predicted nucleic acid-binding protein
MRYLLDTGTLLRIPHRADPFHPTIREALRKLAGAGHTFVSSRQNFAEFWNVCTRPATARGGFAFSAPETARRLRMLERFIAVLREPESAYTRWKELVLHHNVLGNQVHDARIAAVMSANRVKCILTLNEADFVRYGPSLKVKSPTKVMLTAV